jgi:hypothetical protein
MLGPVEIAIAIAIGLGALLEGATIPLLAIAAATPRRTTAKVKFGEKTYEIAVSNIGDDLGRPAVDIAVMGDDDRQFVLTRAETELVQTVGFLEHVYEKGLPPTAEHMRLVGKIVKQRMDEIERTYDRMVIGSM